MGKLLIGLIGLAVGAGVTYYVVREGWVPVATSGTPGGDGDKRRAFMSRVGSKERAFL